MGTLRAFIPLILAPRSLLTAGSSPPFPRAAETSGGPGVQVSRQPHGSRGVPAGQTLSASPERGGPGPCPSADTWTARSVCPAGAELPAATARGAGPQRSPRPAGVTAPRADGLGRRGGRRFKLDLRVTNLDFTRCKSAGSVRYRFILGKNLRAGVERKL